MNIVISQALKNIAADSDIALMIPRRFPALELVAASTALASEVAAAAGRTEPNRHDYLEAIPRYLKTLPNSVEMAVESINFSAAAVLGISGLVADHAQLTEAQSKLAEAQAEVEAAEMIQGKRLSRILRLEQEASTANDELQAWNELDFAEWQNRCDTAILESFGKADQLGKLNSAFANLDKIPTLRRLQPVAVAAITARISAAEAMISDLRAAAPEPEKLTRGRQKLPADELQAAMA